MLMDMGDNMKYEVRQYLLEKAGKNAARPDEKERVVESPMYFLSKGLDAMVMWHDPDWYNNDSNFSDAVQQALALRQVRHRHVAATWPPRDRLLAALPPEWVLCDHHRASAARLPCDRRATSRRWWSTRTSSR